MVGLLNRKPGFGLVSLSLVLDSNIRSVYSDTSFLMSHGSLNTTQTTRVIVYLIHFTLRTKPTNKLLSIIELDIIMDVSQNIDF